MSEQECGSPQTSLVILRGNSGSGKSSIAKAVRDHAGRGCALVEQDYLRRIILREHERVDGLAAQFIAHTVRYLLDHGRDVVLDGILWSGRYGPMIAGLLQTHRGRSHLIYLDVSLEETLRRHQLRPQVAEFTAEDMRGWYNPRDVLGLPDEQVIEEGSSLHDSVALVCGLAWPSKTWSLPSSRGVDGDGGPALAAASAGSRPNGTSPAS